MPVLSMSLRIGFACLCVFLQFQLCACLECYSCTDAKETSECRFVTKCPTGSMCHTSWNSNKFSLGCIASKHCSTSNTSMNGNVGSLVGRSLSARVYNGCFECCETSNCNRQLCQPETTGCHDSGDIDCATTGAFVDICSKADHAKRVCKRFCGLCNLVDGGWSIWTGWSSCSVTCGNGTEIRTRSCSNPAPVNGGSNCTGVSLASRECSMDRCPVNGGWSQWSSWGPCGVTCGIGLQRRNRSCSNPFPSYSGLQCLGESHENSICQSVACQDGGWTEWSGWSACSKTCGPGLQTSSRACTNPAPTLLGKACVGDGNKVKICTVKSCVDKMIGFTAYNLTRIGTDSSNAIFSSVISNKGGGYNSSTGVFTCSVPGEYMFTLNIVKSSIAHTMHCSISKNNTRLARAYVYERVQGLYIIPAIANVFVHLEVRDTVNVEDCTSIENFSASSLDNMFTGYLLHAD